MALATSSISEPKKVTAAIIWDLGDYSQEAVTIASGNGTFQIGEVLGIVTASGKYAKYDNAAVDGTEVAVAIAREPGDATAELLKVAVEKRVATLILSGLVFDPGQDQTAQDAAIADLEAAGFKIVPVTI